MADKIVIRPVGEDERAAWQLLWDGYIAFYKATLEPGAGDVAGVIHCADPDNTGVDMYIGTGGAPEGVLAAVALRCIGGQMQCRLILDSEEKKERAHKMGVTDPRMIYGIEDMARGDCLFAATGVTTGSLLSGVKFRKDVIETETVVMRSVTGTVRYIKAEHRQLEKFHLD